ncbi:hypothetical protein K2173_012992 [Erythroxylum novogranatense]|uniref:Uncharacterized protein n=1 Tax=Erythroxylum novogranatense TaxID=1862640 RepID=A0AAV8S4D3_9ROSI|nr:hypothetical protein K2173_012992 [Erythroxylum novogranatense]
MDKRKKMPHKGRDISTDYVLGLQVTGSRELPMSAQESVDDEVQEIKVHGHSTIKVVSAQNIAEGRQEMNVADEASRAGVIRVTLQGRHLGVEETRAHNHSMMKMAMVHNTMSCRQNKGVGIGENRVSIRKETMQDRNLGTENSKGGLRSKTTNVGIEGASKGGADKEIGDEESSTYAEETDNTNVDSADTEASNCPENEERAPKVFAKMSDPICSGTHEVTDEAIMEEEDVI